MSEPVCVTYTFIDGAHFFTTDDPEWAGLCAASTDLQAARDDVSVQLAALARFNHGCLDGPTWRLKPLILAGKRVRELR